MDFISLSKTNRLFWLGRYYERVSLSIRHMMGAYDAMIDTDTFDYAEYCRQIGIYNKYESVEDFFQRYIFDDGDPDSIRSAAEQMLGNGMVLRETIGSSTLAYLQMAVYTLDEGAEDEVIGLKLLQVLDNIMAFRGSYDDFIAEDAVRNTIKCGASVERLSYTLRTGLRKEFLLEELQKLQKRLTWSNLQTAALPLQSIIRMERILDGRNPEDEISREDFLNAVEGLFLV